MELTGQSTRAVVVVVVKARQAPDRLVLLAVPVS
jgi:hypothetical protein